MVGVVWDLHIQLGPAGNYAVESHFICKDDGPDSSTSTEVVLGLDLLRKHRAVVDIEGDHLIMGGREGVALPFVPPEQVPSCWRSVLAEKHSRR